ncbi:hypothetical protein ACFPYI_00205 [Halomarina salina]|uniref:ZIP Zinc transporter n=1 Tax=Halomarina salina TaxID=1872699 RepID=A0ABD5RH02_9EURY|nr:hypothetical protein [Halomarina salina]
MWSLEQALGPWVVVGQSAASPTVAAAITVALAVVHSLAGRLWAGSDYRPRVLSAAGGASLAYVVVYLLPEINEAVLHVVESDAGSASFFGRDVEVYVVVLTGFLTFYAVHVFASRTTDGETDQTSVTFWAHLASFGVYNALIGYLVFHQERSGTTALVLYGVAMGLHFLVTDAGLRRHHGRTYHRLGRWLLAGAILLGGLVGTLTTVAEGPLALLLAFLAGGIVFNVTKEELPDPETSRFGSFVAGTVGYAAVLLAL